MVWINGLVYILRFFEVNEPYNLLLETKTLMLIS